MQAVSIDYEKVENFANRIEMQGNEIIKTITEIEMKKDEVKQYYRGIAAVVYMRALETLCEQIRQVLSENIKMMKDDVTETKLKYIQMDEERADSIRMEV